MAKKKKGQPIGGQCMGGGLFGYTSVSSRKKVFKKIIKTWRGSPTTLGEKSQGKACRPGEEQNRGRISTRLHSQGLKQGEESRKGKSEGAQDMESLSHSLKWKKQQKKRENCSRMTLGGEYQVKKGGMTDGKGRVMKDRVKKRKTRPRKIPHLLSDPRGGKGGEETESRGAEV